MGKSTAEWFRGKYPREGQMPGKDQVMFIVTSDGRVAPVRTSHLAEANGMVLGEFPVAECGRSWFLTLEADEKHARDNRTMPIYAFLGEDIRRGMPPHEAVASLFERWYDNTNTWSMSA